MSNRCIREFKMPLPIPDSWEWAKKLSWDDVVAGSYFIINFVILILGTVNVVRQHFKAYDAEEEKKIIRSQKILRIVLGTIGILIGFYHLYIYNYFSAYAIQNRIFVGGMQILTGTLFIVFSSYSLTTEEQVEVIQTPPPRGNL